MSRSPSHDLAELRDRSHHISEQGTTLKVRVIADHLVDVRDCTLDRTVGVVVARDHADRQSRVVDVLAPTSASTTGKSDRFDVTISDADAAIAVATTCLSSGSGRKIVSSAAASPATSASGKATAISVRVR